MHLGGFVMEPQHLAAQSSCASSSDAATPHRCAPLRLARLRQYELRYFRDSVRQGRVHAVPKHDRFFLGFFLGGVDQSSNRRLGCPRASKLSLHSVSLPLLQHVVAKNLKKLLSLSRLLPSQCTTNTKNTAGLAFASAPHTHLSLSLGEFGL